MSWIKRHNAEIFRKKVREELSRRLSDGNYSCRVEDIPCGWWYAKQMCRPEISIDYLDVTFTFRPWSCPEYWNYENETVASACDKIIERIKDQCWKFSSERSVNDRSHFAVDFLTSHIFEILGEENI